MTLSMEGWQSVTMKEKMAAQTLRRFCFIFRKSQGFTLSLYTNALFGFIYRLVLIDPGDRVALRLLPAQTGTNERTRILPLGKRDSARSRPGTKTNMPPKGAILFVGSSSIRKWTTLAQDFPASR